MYHVRYFLLIDVAAKVASMIQSKWLSRGDRPEMCQPEGLDKLSLFQTGSNCQKPLPPLLL